MIGMPLTMFQNRQRRNQLPSSIKKQDGSPYSGEFGYPPIDALMIAFSDTLASRVGMGFERAKAVAESEVICSSLREAFKKRVDDNTPVFVSLVLWSEDYGADPHLIVAGNPLAAMKWAGDYLSECGYDELDQVITIELSDALDRVHGGFDGAGYDPAILFPAGET